MRRWLGRAAIGLALVGGLGSVARAGRGDAPEPWLQAADPVAAGWSAEGLERARALAERIGSAAVLVVREGVVACAWGDVERRFRCHSIRKSLVSALIGTAVDEGALDPEATLDEFGFEAEPTLQEGERAATIRELLTSRSGIYHPAAKETDAARSSRPERGTHEPDERWWYNNWGFNALGAIYEQATAASLFEAFEQRIARPIGMQDFSAGDGLAELEPSRSRIPAHAFRMSTRDLARFGELVLRDGRWGGRVVLPSDWLHESTAVHSELDGGKGYGYMWWVYPAGGFGEGSALSELDRYHKLAAIGAGGHLLLVVPELELVIVHRADTDHAREVEGGSIWELAEQLVAAIVCEASEDLELVPLDAQPFDDALPGPTPRRGRPIQPEALAVCCGDYELAPGHRIRIHALAARLFAHDLTRDRETELIQDEEGHFFSRTIALELDFLSEGGAPARALRGTLMGEAFEAPRVEG